MSYIRPLQGSAALQIMCRTKNLVFLAMLLSDEISLIHAQNGIYKKISVKILTVTFPFAAKSFKLKICSRIGLEGGCLFSSVPIRCLEGRKDVKIKNFISALFSSSLRNQVIRFSLQSWNEVF